MRCPRKGKKVVFMPNPVSAAMYSPGYGLPFKGEVGTVTTVPLPGGRKTCLKGPGGGLVYVDWEGLGVRGIAPRDLEDERGEALGGGRSVADQPKEWVVLDTRSGTTKRVWFNSRRMAEIWNARQRAGTVMHFNALTNEFEDAVTYEMKDETDPRAWGHGKYVKPWGGVGMFEDPDGKMKWLYTYEDELRALLAGREFPKHSHHLTYGHMVALKMTPHAAAVSYLKQTKYGSGMNLGCAECGPMSGAEYVLGTPLDDFEARDLLYQWHGGQGSGVYQVASMMDHGVPEGAYQRARGELAYARNTNRQHSNHKHARQHESELDALIVWLDEKIGEE